MRALFALVGGLVCLATAAGAEGGRMAGEDDVIHLATMAAPPWSASAHEQITSDRTGFEPCEQILKTFGSPGGYKVLAETCTTSPRWGKILRARFMSDGAVAATLVTCWVGADGRGSVVVKIDDGEP